MTEELQEKNSAQVDLENETKKLQDKLKQFSSKPKVKAGLTSTKIDYSKYIGAKVKIASVELGTKPDYWKEGKRYPYPVGVKPCLIATTEPLDTITEEDGTKREITVDVKLNVFFVKDKETGEEILTFTKDPKGMCWKFCRRLGIENPYDAVGKTVEIEQQINEDPTDDSVWIQIRI